MGGLLRTESHEFFEGSEIDISAIYDDEASPQDHWSESKASSREKPFSDPDVATNRKTSCLPCSAKVHGALPTTYRGQWPTAAHCTWEKTLGFLLGYAADTSSPFPRQAAQEYCVQMGSACSGITCHPDESACSLRRDSSVQRSPSGEFSFLKRCPPRDSGCGNEEPEDLPPQSSLTSPNLTGSAVVVLAHSRHESLRLALWSLLEQAESTLFRIIVSLDVEEPSREMTETIQDAADRFSRRINTWQIPPQVADPAKHNKAQIDWFGWNTGKIAHHYYSVFERVFMQERLEHAIFVEEDLIFAPDFFALFRSTYWLLKADSSLWCVSAWNDAGFIGSASDPCRLQRTSYFPGLGFLLTREAWLRVRGTWPISPNMGWDYWMRTAFRREGKECVIPEVPRTHHAAKDGSSVTTDEQVNFFKQMLLADLPSSCVSGPCRHFGDLTYLLSDTYEAWMRDTIQRAPRIQKKNIISAEQSMKLDPGTTYVLPFKYEEYDSMVELLSIRPKGISGKVIPDVRAEHYGIVKGVHRDRRSTVLLVDVRSPRQYLEPHVQKKLSPLCVPVLGEQGESCLDACKRGSLVCDDEQLYFLNECNRLQDAFPCEDGCAHQVGEELPVYVSDPEQMTYRQCLVTFISAMHCHTSHESTRRLCACMPA